MFFGLRFYGRSCPIGFFVVYLSVRRDAVSLTMRRLKKMKQDKLGQPQMQKGGKNDV